MKPAVLVSTGLLLAAAPVSAESWRVVGQGGPAPDRIVYLVDTDSVQRDGDTVSFLSMTIWESYSDGNYFNKTIAERKGSCSAKSSMILSNTYYADGSLENADSGNGETIVHGPNSVMAGVLAAACSERAYATQKLDDAETSVRANLAARR